MRKLNVWGVIAAWAVIEDEKRKQENRHHQRQESKNFSQQIRKRNISKSLGQHKFMNSIYRSR